MRVDCCIVVGSSAIQDFKIPITYLLPFPNNSSFSNFIFRSLFLFLDLGTSTNSDHEKLDFVHYEFKNSQLLIP